MRGYCQVVCLVYNTKRFGTKSIPIPPFPKLHKVVRVGLTIAIHIMYHIPEEEPRQSKQTYRSHVHTECTNSKTCRQTAQLRVQPNSTPSLAPTQNGYVVICGGVRRLRCLQASGGHCTLTQVRTWVSQDSQIGPTPALCTPGVQTSSQIRGSCVHGPACRWHQTCRREVHRG